MSRQDERRDADTRKLEALLAIGVAIGTLGTNLTQMFRENLDQTEQLRQVQAKLDKLLAAEAERQTT